MSSLLLDSSWLIPLLPILSFIVIILTSRLKRSPDLAGYIAALFVGSAFLLSLLVITQLGQIEEDNRYTNSRTWFEVGDNQFTYGVYIDHLTALMLVVVGLVSFLVVVYSLGYMAHEGRRRTRYYAEISLFVGVMLGLVLANNFLLMFIFWELVGVCSYLLIGFWYEKPSAASAAKKAFIVTRAGDISFLIGLIIIWNTFRSFDFDYLFDPANLEGHASELKWATLFIFGGAVGKSAQFPLHVWLPDAMEGPTTVSALIHAATMVKAGVYLVARAYPLFVESPDTMMVVAVVGGFTAFIAASMALVMYDIKRVLAYSTISQLGYMFLALGAGGYLVSQEPDIEEVKGYTAGMFHLMNHAFFKALLFLGAGSVIHCAATQDMREMGGLRKYMPITSLTMGLGILSIAGFPLFSGFWSKDELLAAVYESGSHDPLFYVLWILGLVTAMMTSFYMARLWFMTFSGSWRGDKEHQEHLHESPQVMTTPLMVLGVLAALSGLIAIMGIPGFTEGGFSSYLNHPQNEGLDLDHGEGFVDVATHTFTSWLTYLSIAAGLGGLALGYLFYNRGIDEELPTRMDAGVFTATTGRAALHKFLTNRLYMSYMYNRFGMLVFTHAAAACDWFDRKVIDGIVNAMAGGSAFLSRQARRLQTGIFNHYALLIVAGLFLMLLAFRIFPEIGRWEP